MQKAYAASSCFTGEQWLHDYAVVLDGAIIKELVPLSDLSSNIECKNFGDALLAPAFIDVQVYGAAGKLLAVYPEADTLRLMYEHFAKEGTCLFQPTVATNTVGVFKKCIDAVKQYWKEGGRGVHGFHLEGPWLNPEKRGAHVKEWIHSPTITEVQELLDYGKGVISMITIAPEVCSDDIISLIQKNNIILSAGHSNATFREATESFNKGIHAVTHLYNAMSPLQHREPGLVGAAMVHSAIMASIIPDGHHVDYNAIAIANKVMEDRLFAITDAVTETSIGPYQHHFTGDKFESNGVLSGSAINMHQAFYNLVQYARVDVGKALKMCSLYPAKVLHIDHRYGKIVPGHTGQFVVLDKQLKLVDVII